MFFKKSGTSAITLTDLVSKISDTGYVFWNINDDLGHAAQQIMASSPEVKMAYGYARRTAVAGLYLQGLVNRDVFEHASGIFRALQHQTGHTVEFQENAAADATKFMRTYNYLISGLLEKKLIQIAQEYEIGVDRRSDAELFAAVVETIHSEQEQARRL